MLSVTVLPMLNALSGRSYLKHLALSLTAIFLCSCGGSDDAPTPPPGPAAPTSLSYPGAQPYVFTERAAIVDLQPTVTGTVTGYAVAPALPAGLTLNATTGVISGTPTTAATAASHTITASNAGGSTSVAISIAVNLAVPAALTYPVAPAFAVGTAIAPLSPTVTGTVQTWSSTALPSGLVLSPTTGVLSGTPTLPASRTAYRITATNSAGSTSYDLIFTVDASTPRAFSYPSPVAVPKGSAMTPLLPTVQNNPTIFGISPALPAGLTFDTATGGISGTPSLEMPETAYIVIASNVAGAATFVWRLTVNPPAPSQLSYPAQSPFVSGTPITDFGPATVIGDVTHWSVAPALPTGLSLNTATGRISGTPRVVTALSDYTVTASNASGSTSAVVPLAVYPARLTQADADIGECINMGDHLEAPNEGDWGRRIVDQDFLDIRARGFETVRIPVRFSNHALKDFPYTLEAAFLDRVEHVVDAARTAGLRVIIDMHHYSDADKGNIFTHPMAQKDRFTAMWEQIAGRFRNKDAKVWFELLHEPQDQITNGTLLSVIDDALAKVRATNPTRTVVIGGAPWSNIDSLDTLILPADNYVIATFHYYDSFEFTHQGAPWVTPVLGRRPFPTPADELELQQDFLLARDFMVDTGRPLILGEYGTYQDIPVAERADWTKRVHDGFKAHNVRGCAWAYTATMYFRRPDTGAWIPELLTAIGLPAP